MILIAFLYKYWRYTITANISRVDHNITVGARFPRPYNVARVQLKTAVSDDFRQRIL